VRDVAALGDRLLALLDLLADVDLVHHLFPGDVHRQRVSVLLNLLFDGGHSRSLPDTF
jgi:hypothetical protein